MANTIGRKLRQAPPEAKGKVKEIIELSNLGSVGFCLSGYSENDLSSARAILREHNLRMPLRKCIEQELNRRMELSVKRPGKKAARLEPYSLMWEAVRALFGKGPWERGDPEVKMYLGLIKSEWRKI